jgi:RecB family exonuclease
LHSFRFAIRFLVHGSVLVVVPSRSAAKQLRQTLALGGIDAIPPLVDRDGLYDDLHARLLNPPPRLTQPERGAIAYASARHMAAAIGDLPFRVRPGLVAEVLGFYDLLRRQSQRVARFESLVEDQVAGHAGTDPGTDRLLQQTHFLAGTFREYERRVGATSAVDEHGLRNRLIEEPPREAVRHLIVTVPDWIADPNGLFVADFDLLSRLPGLESLDVVATEALLGSGFHERLHTWLPGIEETSIEPPAVARPRLVTPGPSTLLRAGSGSDVWFTHRDREEELIAVARNIARDCPVSLDRTGVVFRRPLPYLYLAGDTLGAAGIPFQASDALPLAAEPAVAALDLILDAAASNFSRSSLVALLRSPHFALGVARADTNVLDRFLSAKRYLGEIARLEALAVSGDVPERARAPLSETLGIVRKLAPLVDSRAASDQLRVLSTFFETHARQLEDGDPFAARERRARAAIVEGLARLASAHASYDDPAWTTDDLAGAVRRWIEGETFVPEWGTSGVHLVDDRAAGFGTFDDLTIVGIIEGEWPDRPRRNIFYSSAIMKALGWPSERDRRAAEEARFADLLGSASQSVRLSTITLDDEALVEPSSLLDEVPRARLSSSTQERGAPARVFVDEVLALDGIPPDTLSDDARVWAEARAVRSPHDAAKFHGATGACRPRDSGRPEALEERAWSVSALETYLGCPFKFFAQHVLRLEEEPDDEEVMDPRRQGLFVHEVFEQFFGAWHTSGGRAITPSNLEEARALFAATVDRLVEQLPGAEGGLVRTQLLGSSSAAGLGEAVLRMEAERPVEVIERLLEHRLDGRLTIETESGPRVVHVKGKADRLDLLADGTFRVIDYKLGWPPQRQRALQLPIYSLRAEQQLANLRASEAVYLAFKGPRRVVPLFTTDAERADVMSKAQARVADTLDRIGRGEFPPTPDDVYRCETCSFAAVCRKDYVGDV